MSRSMYKAPVIPGPAGARRPLRNRMGSAPDRVETHAGHLPSVVGAPAAKLGEPGHFERLLHPGPLVHPGPHILAVWPLTQRWHAEGLSR